MFDMGIISFIIILPPPKVSMVLHATTNRTITFKSRSIRQVLEEASSSGLALEADNDFPPLEVKWTTVQAIFFSSTVLTTIGV